MAETTNDIRHRISPDAIKAEVSNYIQSRGEQLVNDVTSAARRNPMQAVAVGASIAYPLLKIARAIPYPVLMVGAGLFFADSKTGQAATQKVSNMATNLSEEIVRRGHALSDQVQDTASSASNYASDQYDRVSSVMAAGSSQFNGTANAGGATIGSGSDKIKDSAVSAGAALSERANSIKEDGLRIAGSTAATVQDIASGATAAAQSAANLVTDTGMDAARTVIAKASDVSVSAGKTIFQTIEHSPLLVAGVGLLVGGLIASALPRSEFEDDLVGDTSAAAKHKVQAAASQAFDTAKTAAGEVFDETSRQVKAEGLNTEGIEKAAQDITQRIRRVAEVALTKAFEPSQENHRPTARGENDHG